MTALEIYKKSLALLGETIDPEAANTAAFRAAAPYCINLLLAELAELNDAIQGEPADAGKEVAQISSLEDEVPLVPVLALGALPLGLAFYLLLEEDPDRAAFFFRLYRQEITDLRRNFGKARRHLIREVY